MGIGAGHILDMINRSKQNSAQRPSKRRKFRDNSNVKSYVSSVNHKLQFKTVSKEELDLIKNQIRTTVKKESRIRNIKRLIVFSMLILFVIFLILW